MVLSVQTKILESQKKIIYTLTDFNTDDSN